MLGGNAGDLLRKLLDAPALFRVADCPVAWNLKLDTPLDVEFGVSRRLRDDRQGDRSQKTEAQGKECCFAVFIVSSR